MYEYEMRMRVEQKLYSFDSLDPGNNWWNHSDSISLRKEQKDGDAVWAWVMKKFIQ